MKSSVLAEPVLVGRERELEELMHSLDSAVGGKGATVFVSGEAGTGKTRLTTEFLNRAKKQGAAALSGWCLSNAAVPYFPFFEAFKVYFSGEQEAKKIGPEELDVTAWLKGPAQDERLGKTPIFSAQAWKDQTFAAVTKTLTAISTRKPVVLFIDDIHWADSASLALIHYIARATKSEKLLLVATFRSEELTADAEGRPHPLVETLRLMKRENLFREIRIANLNQTSVIDLAKSMLGGDVQEDFTKKLSEESQGNALFVVESIRMLHERNSLVQEHERWRLVSDEVGIPDKIKDIILQRLSMLLHGQRRMLDAASVIGEKFDVELLASVLGQDYLEVADTLDMIGQATSLVCVEGEHYQFDHARSRDAIYGGISPALRRGFHARVAEKLESTVKDGRLPFSEVAYHYAQAGNREKSVQYALAAGQDALSRWSNAEAIRQFTYVLSALGEDPKRIEEKLSALEGLGDAFYANSMFKEATRIFEEIANTATTDTVKLRAFRKAMESVFQYGDMPHLTELVKKAEPYAAVDRLENARILGSKGRVFTMQRMPSAALEVWKEALQVFEEEYSLWDVAWASIGVGSMHTLHGDFYGTSKVGLAQTLRSVVLFEELRDFRWQMEACFVAGLAFAMCLLHREELEMFTKAIEIDDKLKMGDYLRLVYTNADMARAFWDIGDFEKALACSLKALRLSEKTDSAVAHGMVYSNLTIEYALLGDMKRSEKYFEELMKLPPEILTHVFIQIPMARSVFFAVKNQWKESNQTFEDTLEVHRASTMAFLPRVKRLYAWALEKQGRFEEAKILREEIQREYRKAEERFAHASLQANFMARKQVVVGEKFEVRLDLVNAGRKTALLVEVRNVLPDDLEVTSLPPWCSTQDGAVEMKNKEIDAFQVNTAKLTVRSLKAGTFTLNPQVVYVDDLGETKTCNLRPVTITASPPTPKERLPGKIYSGTADLDRLLLGGIPEDYAVALTAPSSDELSLLVERFLEAGAEAGETTFYVTVEPENARRLAAKYPSNFFLFLCNPQADAMTQGLPNIFKLKGTENLTDVDIALTKAFRTMNPSAAGARRICIDIVSDVLLQHHAITTRRWLSALLPTLKSKGFTTLAVVNPKMHPQEELEAVLGLFDGEISINEKETTKGTARFLKVKKMTGQKYLKDEVLLTEE